MGVARLSPAEDLPDQLGELIAAGRAELIGIEVPGRWTPNPQAPLDRLTEGERRILAPVVARGGRAMATAWSTMELAGSVAILGDIVSPAVPAEQWEAEGPQDP